MIGHCDNDGEFQKLFETPYGLLCERCKHTAEAEELSDNSPQPKEVE